MADGITADTAAYRAIAKKMKEADKAIQKEYTKALREIAKPYGNDVLVTGAARLPSGGGLAYRVASSRVTVQASSMKAQISLKSQDGYDLVGMNEGEIRHPTFGNRNNWQSQDSEEGIFTEPFQAGAEKVRAAMLEAGQAVLDSLGEK